MDNPLTDEALNDGRDAIDVIDVTDDTDEILGLGGILLRFDNELLMFALDLATSGLGVPTPVPTLIRGRPAVATRADETGAGEGAGDSDGTRILLRERML